LRASHHLLASSQGLAWVPPLLTSPSPLLRAPIQPQSQQIQHPQHLSQYLQLSQIRSHLCQETQVRILRKLPLGLPCH